MADKSLDFENYRKYSSDPNPTTNADLQDYMSNQNVLTTELTEQFLWQPLTAYAVGDIVHSKNIEGGKVARCTQAGTTGSEEPVWNATVTDGTCKWELTAESLTASDRVVLNSGITAAKVSQYDEYASSKQDTLDSTQMEAVDSGMTAEDKEKYDEYEATINAKATPTGTNYNAGEVFYNADSSGSINLNNGLIQKTSASTITLPSVPSGHSKTLTLYCTASAITWAGASRKWDGGVAPVIGSGTHVFTFVSDPSASCWYGNYIGSLA